MLRLLSENKTYIAAVGLLGMSLYSLSAGNYEMAIQYLFAGLAAAALRSDMAKANS